jgi:hypothetical protein
MVVSPIVSGVGMTKVGYYTPFLIAGTCMVSVGAGLLTILKVNATTGQWIVYQIVYDLGLGCCFQSTQRRCADGTPSSTPYSTRLARTFSTNIWLPALHASMALASVPGILRALVSPAIPRSFRLSTTLLF